jgi:hypothetical protein
METDPLESARAKLDRANNQLRELKEQFRIGWDKHLYGINTYEDFGTHETIVIIVKPRSLFVDYSIRVGEIVHHMRSALEHAIWQMVPNPSQGRTGFPVFTLEHKDSADPNKRHYERDGLRMIDGINPAAATLIHSLQPFATGIDQRLSVLNDMWNWEKHRLLNMMVIFLNAVAPWWRYLSDGRALALPAFSVPTDLDDRAEITRIPHPSDFVQGEVQMEAEVAVSIRFTDGPAKGKSPEEFLLSLLDFCSSTISALSKTL